jgi:hypothetical protein
MPTVPSTERGTPHPVSLSSPHRVYATSAANMARRAKPPSPTPKSDVSDFGHVGCQNAGKPAIGGRGGVLFCSDRPEGVVPSRCVNRVGFDRRKWCAADPGPLCVGNLSEWKLGGRPRDPWFLETVSRLGSPPAFAFVHLNSCSRPSARRNLASQEQAP